MSLPFISVLVLNLNGRRHLKPCLSSLGDQDYPSDRFEVVLVDNGSSDGSVELTRERHPWVRVLELRRNFGFTGAYARAIQHARGDYLLFLNNDTRVEPDWLRQMERAADEEGATAVASKMVSWDGRQIDFGGGIVSLIGHAWQVDQGRSPGSHALDRKPLLFGCGGSVMFERGAYERVGGFDTDYFIYFEDVDLGWRLALMGYKAVFAPQAVTYHQLHGTVTDWAATLKLRLYERNALYTIYKNYEDHTLARILPCAIALTLARGLRYSALDVEQFRQSGLPDSVDVAPQTVATLIALEDFANGLPRFKEKRDWIQSRRVVSDEEIWPLFVEPLKTHALGDEYEAMARELYALFRLPELISLSTARAGRPARPSERVPPVQSISRSDDLDDLSALTIHPNEPTLEAVMPVALLVAVCRSLTRADLAEDSTSAGNPGWFERLRVRCAPASLKGHLRGELSRRGARRALGVVGNLRKLGFLGPLRVLKSLLVFLLREGPRPVDRRAAYLIERGIRPHDRPSEPLPRAAVEPLLDIDEWLHSIAELRRRREEMQSRRKRSDSDIVDRTSRQWSDETLVANPACSELYRNLVRPSRIDG